MKSSEIAHIQEESNRRFHEVMVSRAGSGLGIGRGPGRLIESAEVARR